ncbi:SDR family oxidoreductase [Massilia sp. W12]|uniref:SDR family oxidoreductase n=1 Tax=Massilia sp. W12 TaxID=3126507 RepID=UPI0030D252F4
MKKIIIIGATSAIAAECARRFAQAGDHLFLVARDDAKLQVLAADLRVRGAPAVHTFVLDVDDLARHAAMLSQANAALGAPDTVLIAHGTLPDQAACEQSVQMSLAQIHTNALSVIALLTPLAQQFQQQGHGVLAVISSVAGERGRQSNYVYGSAKAMVTAFLSGLRQRLCKHGVHVLTIKPGFVATPMTAGMPLPAALTASAQQAADDIVRAIARKTDVLYTRWFWRYIMLIIRHLPEGVFKRTKI